MQMLLQAATQAGEPSILLVVLMGLGVVFFGLIVIILLCKVMSLASPKEKKKKNKAEEPTPIKTEVRLPDEVIAAIGAVIAEDAGVGVDAIRIVSVNKI